MAGSHKSICWYLSVHADIQLAQRAVSGILEHFPRSRIIIRTDGDDSPCWEQVHEWSPEIFLQRPEAQLAELFLYRNAQAYESWDESGCTDENSLDMVHVIPGDGMLTVVHDGLDMCEIRHMFVTNNCFA